MNLTIILLITIICQGIKNKSTILDVSKHLDTFLKREFVHIPSFLLKRS